MKDLRATIAQHSFLHGLKPEYLDLLARHAREIEFNPRQIIFRQNQAAYEFFLITQGRVAIESSVARADDVPLQVIGGGDVLGWSWLFPPFTWHFQARALELTEAIFLDGARLLVACENDHGFGYELMNRVAKIVIKRLQTNRKRLVGLNPAEGLLAAVDETRLPRAEVGTTAGKSLEIQLSEHPFLKGMKAEHFKMLAESAMPTQFDAGQLIFREGDMANRFYLVHHGKVLLELPQTEGRAVPIQMIRDGDVLGWSWLFPPYYWHFDARALEPTSAVFLYGTRIREQCEADQDFGYDLMKRVVQVLIQRLQAVRRQLIELHAGVARGETASTAAHGRD